MDNPTTFHALATHLHTLLEAEFYSKTTMKDMEFILNLFTVYMIGNGLDEYTSLSGTSFGPGRVFCRSTKSCRFGLSN